jgi:hypothetical protein
MEIKVMKIFKKIIATPLAWGFFGLGVFASQVGYWEAYQNAMGWSVRAQEWGELDSPWKI